MDTNKMLINNKQDKNKKFLHCNFFPKNHRGDKILSVYWFAVLLIVAGGIFAMVYIFYGVPYDIRDIENHFLVNTVADCISYNGKINQGIAHSGEIIQNTSFLEGCHMMFNSDGWEQEQYYTEVNFYKITDMGNSLLTLKKGNNNWVSQCEIEEKKEFQKLVQCSTKVFYSLDNENNQYIIKILGVVRKSEKNVKL
jgi:hypothetical protein